MKIRIIGTKIRVFDFNTQAEIEVDINDLYRTLKEYGFEILDWYDSRRKSSPQKESLTERIK